MIEYRPDLLPEAFALRGQIDSLVAAIRRFFPTFDVASFFQVVHQAAQAGFAFDGTFGQSLLGGSLFSPQAAEHLQHFECNADTVLSQGSLDALAEGDAHADDLKLELPELTSFVDHSVKMWAQR